MAYTKEQAIELAKQTGMSELSAYVFVTKYCMHDGDKYYEATMEDVSNRHIDEMIKFESKRVKDKPALHNLRRSYKMLYEHWLPAGRIMYALGNKFDERATLMNCYVLEITEDSFNGMTDVVNEMMKTFAHGGGLGFELKLRPRGAKVSNTNVPSGGNIQFMHVLSSVTNMIEQNGRKGALMLTMSINHPDVMEFISSKEDKSKITHANISIWVTSKFMDLVVDLDNNPDVTWDTSFTDDMGRTFTRQYKVKELWDLFIKMNHSGAEPALLFKDAIHTSPSSVFPESKAISTNPCIVGSTKVAVADGRGFVSIEELAETGEDVLVHAYDNDLNRNVVKLMRHPRITGHNEKIYRVKFDNGTHVDVTGNHELLLSEGGYIRADKMKTGESIHIVNIFNEGFGKQILNKPNKYGDYRWVKPFDKPIMQEHRMVWESINGDIPNGYVVHHIDGDRLNNKIENLQLMTISEHSSHHMTEHNPMHHLNDPKGYSENMSKIMSGEGNPSYKGITNKELFEVGVKLAKSLGRPFGYKEFARHCKENNISMNMWNDMRMKEFGSPKEFCDKCNIDADIGYTEEDINMNYQVVEQKFKMVKLGYNTRYAPNTQGGTSVEVERVCEMCENKFWIKSYYREQGVCGISCANKLRYKKGEWVRSDKHKKKLDDDRQQKRIDQVKVYTELKMINEMVTKKKWMIGCKEKGIPSRLGKNSPFKTFAELRETAGDFNHRVVSIEIIGEDVVYNGTVDDVHNFYTSLGDGACINNLNCGEMPLPRGGSCNLNSFDLSSFVEYPFTDRAKFDFNKFRAMISVATRFADNIIDINMDKHALDIQKQVAMQGRRIGVGVMGVADMLIKMGLVYGSKESIDFLSKVMEMLKRSTVMASIELAEVRGMFTLLATSNKEKFNEFINHKYFKDLNLPENYLKLMRKSGIRNNGFNTVAPTGSIALSSGISSGIEPAFRFSYERTTLGGKYIVYHKSAEEYNNIYGKDAHLKNKAFVDSSQIKPHDRVMMQACVQKYVSESISSTVNLPKTATEKDVEQIYIDAYKNGLKGITVYVDGSREGVLNEKKDNNTSDAKLMVIGHDQNKWYVTYTLNSEGLPNTLFVMSDAKESKKLTLEVMEEFGNVAIDFGMSTDELNEINKRYSKKPNSIKIVRSIRTLLNLDVPITDIVSTIDSLENVTIGSFVYQVKKLLASFIDGHETGESCPQCKDDGLDNKLVHDNGCTICKSCGYSRC